jgi:hypothetical protein
MATIIFKANGGLQTNYSSQTNWVNPSYAWDNNDSNYATVTVYNTYSQDLYPTFNTITGQGSISKVWLGVKWKSSIKGFFFYTTFYNTNLIVNTANVEQTDWIEVTNEIPLKNWSGVNTFVNSIERGSLYFYCVSIFTPATVSVNQFYVKVEAVSYYSPFPAFRRAA